MVIADKSKLVRRICRLEASLHKAVEEANEIFQAVLSWEPENDARPGCAASGLPLVDGPPLAPFDHGIGASSLPLEDRDDLRPPLGNLDGGSERGSDVYYETRTAADLAAELVVSPKSLEHNLTPSEVQDVVDLSNSVARSTDEPMLDSD